MTRPTDMTPTTWVTVCETCKREDWQAGEAETSGERLAALVEAAAQGSPVAVRRHACLMGCTRACNVAVQAQGKLAYTLGGFAPEPDAARAIVEWAALHAESESGVVAYRSWPEAVKGHFVTRHPPLPGS
jgi:predicted metal-binding protein